MSKVEPSVSATTDSSPADEAAASLAAMKVTAETDTTPSEEVAENGEATPSEKQDSRSILIGKWKKDKKASDDMEEICTLAGINYVTKQAVKLISGMEIDIDEDHFHVAAVSVIPWYKIKEQYPLNGESAKFPRRDWRSGKHEGKFEVVESSPVEGKDGEVAIQVAALNLSWGTPAAGTERTVYTIEDDKLICTSTTNIEGKGSTTYKLVYTRK